MKDRHLLNQERRLPMLNITNVRREVQIENLLVVGVDVSKDKLDLYAEHTDSAETHRQELDGELPNRNDQIEAMLRELEEYADEKGLGGLLVVCEPTGGYEDQLLETTRRLGHQTAYVNGEHVSNASVIDPDSRRDRARPTGWTLA
jgi:transposase